MPITDIELIKWPKSHQPLENINVGQPVSADKSIQLLKCLLFGNYNLKQTTRIYTGFLAITNFNFRLTWHFISKDWKQTYEEKVKIVLPQLEVKSLISKSILFFLSPRLRPVTKAWMIPPLKTRAMIWLIMVMVWLTTRRRAAPAFRLVWHTAQTKSVSPCLRTLDEHWWCSSAWGWPTWSSQTISLTRAPQNTKPWSNAS